MFRLSRREKVLIRIAPITERSDTDRRMRVAVLRARRHRAVAAEFAQQQSFDKALAGLVRNIPVSAEIAEWFRNEKLIPQKKRNWKKTAKNPVVLTIAVAVAVIAGMTGLMVMERMNDFPGSGRAKKFLTLAGTTRGAELDRIQTEAGALSDLFFLKYRLEHYNVPPEFAHVQTAGVRVFDDDEGLRVAQVSVPEKRMQFFLFPAERDRQTGKPLEFTGWRFISHDTWTGAVHVHAGVCFMAALRGDRKDLEPYITAAKQAAAAEAGSR
ncbi:hypothetical protein BH20VER1_BH20VER1_17640 [soil metagenome]